MTRGAAAKQIRHRPLEAGVAGSILAGAAVSIHEAGERCGHCRELMYTQQGFVGRSQRSGPVVHAFGLINQKGQMFKREARAPRVVEIRGGSVDLAQAWNRRRHFGRAVKASAC